MGKKILLFFLFYLLFSVFFEPTVAQEKSYIKDPLKLTEYLTDETSTLKPEELSTLRRRLKSFYDSTSTQIVVLILKSLNGETIEEVANSIFRYNKIGTKGKDNGILLLISKEDRKIRIEVGYGLEGILPDVIAKKIIQTEISPSLKKDLYYEGISRGIEALISVTKSEYAVTPDEKDTNVMVIIAIVAVFALVFIFFIVNSIVGRGRSGGGESGNYYSSPDSYSSYSSNDYSSSSSDDSGFSGGGGDSGGGGASDDF